MSAATAATPFGSARTGFVAAIVGRGAAAIPLLVGPLTFAGMLVGLVIADDAARTRPVIPIAKP